ncbi:hypothetical protein EV426DRAFT_709287 [Tirmania nivea]|nr:hypothetical protein EV426DRAFT_709287 [Tirmania nivea]
MSKSSPPDPLVLSDKGRRVISSADRQLASQGRRYSKPASKRWATNGIYCQVVAIYVNIISYPSQSERLELETSAAVLTQAESDIRIGALSCNKLDAWILSLWGFLPFACYFNSSPTYIPGCVYVGYAEWLSYCIKWNHCFGVVHAGIAALLRSRMYSLLLPSPKVDKPNAALWYDTCICTDGVHTANWEAPVLEIQGYKMLDMSKLGSRGTRRVWDICANRVIPWADSLTPQAIVPISHAWVAPEEREYIVTSVNHYLWPVPLPRGVRLEDIRKELIQHSIQYAWLDVLCLRQEARPQLRPSKLRTLLAEMKRFHTGCSHSRSYPDIVTRREERRMREWEVDVPFIGNLYMLSPRVFVYLSGLGRPFNPNQNWVHSQNWLRRAWTLQETKPRENTIIGGLSAGMDPWTCKIDKIGTTLERALLNITTHQRWPNFARLFTEMRSRSASKPLDKIWGLFFPCMKSLGRGRLTTSESITLPLYDENQKPEHAWQLLVHALAKIEGPRPEPARGTCEYPTADTLALYLLLHFPHPSAKHWFPSWRQVHRYPDVSLQEQQVDDQITPSMNAPLSIKWGRLYRRVKLILCMARGAKSRLLLAIGPGNTGVVCLGSINSRSARDLGLISGQIYTLLDLTPFYAHQMDAVHDRTRSTSSTIQGIRKCRDVFRPMWNMNLIIICRELSKWNPPPSGNSARAPYQYRLRRLTSRIWRRGHDEHWLPFKETVRTMLGGEIVPTTRSNLPWEWCIPNSGEGEPSYIEAVLQ